MAGHTPHDSRPETVLVTGASGLIGSALSRHYMRLGWAVHTAQRSGDLSAPEGTSPHQLDILDAHAVSSLLAVVSPRLVIHLAGESDLARCAADPVRTRQVNVEGAANVLAAASACTTPPAVIHGSSIHAYAAGAASPIAESAPLAGGAGYGPSKAEADGLFVAAARRGLRAGVLRFAHVYGPSDPVLDRIVPALARAVTDGSALRLRGSRETALDLLWIGDAVDAFIALGDELLRGERADGPTVFNVGSGTATSVRRLIELASEVAGSVPRVELPVPEPAPSPPRVLDIGLAREVLGWRPATELRTGLQQVISAARAEAQVAGRG